MADNHYHRGFRAGVTHCVRWLNRKAAQYREDISQTWAAKMEEAVLEEIVEITKPSEINVQVLAARIRALPFTPDTILGRRQGWMRECAACVVEGREPPLPPPEEPTVVTNPF